MLHNLINDCYEKMNSSLPTVDNVSYYWVAESRDLIYAIELINDLHDKLKNTESAFELDEYYAGILEKCKSFLKKGGSTISSFMDKVVVYYSIPIFIKKDSVKINIDSIKHIFGRFMVKDFVKSVKGTEFPKYFDKDITQEEFDQRMEVFYKYRGNLLTGGIYIKEYLNLKHYGDHTNEYRVFYINNKIATITRNSGQSINALLPPQQLLEKYSHLESGYYTVDYAELENGSWKIIETGDGQVSGLAEYQDYEQYFKVLYEYLNE